MFKFHKTEPTPRILSNIFLEFEDQFGLVVHWTIDDTTEYEIRLDQNGEEYDQPISITYEKIFDKIKNEKNFEKYFDELIDSIYSHINEQLKNFNNWECGTFFNSNNLFFEDFKPDKRVKEINIGFFEGLTGYSHEGDLDEIQTEIKTYSIDKYHTYFYKFYDRFKEFETIFSRVDVTLNHQSNSKSVIKSKRELLQDIQFFELKSIKELTFEKQEQIIDLLFSNANPYQVALLEYLGLFDFLGKKVFTKTEIIKMVSTALEVSVRTIKGNYYVLNKSSTMNRFRYQSHLKLEQVKKDVEKIF